MICNYLTTLCLTYQFSNYLLFSSATTLRCVCKLLYYCIIEQYEQDISHFHLPPTTYSFRFLGLYSLLPICRLIQFTAYLQMNTVYCLFANGYSLQPICRWIQFTICRWIQFTAYLLIDAYGAYLQMDTVYFYLQMDTVYSIVAD